MAIAISKIINMNKLKITMQKVLNSPQIKILNEAKNAQGFPENVWKYFCDLRKKEGLCINDSHSTNISIIVKKETQNSSSERFYEIY